MHWNFGTYLRIVDYACLLCLVPSFQTLFLPMNFWSLGPIHLPKCIQHPPVRPISGSPILANDLDVAVWSVSDESNVFSSLCVLSDMADFAFHRWRHRWRHCHASHQCLNSADSQMLWIYSLEDLLSYEKGCREQNDRSFFTEENDRPFLRFTICWQPYLWTSWLKSSNFFWSSLAWTA